VRRFFISERTHNSCYTRSTEGRSAAPPSTADRSRGAEAYDAGHNFRRVRSIIKIIHSISEKTVKTLGGQTLFSLQTKVSFSFRRIKIIYRFCFLFYIIIRHFATFLYPKAFCLFCIPYIFFCKFWNRL